MKKFIYNILMKIMPYVAPETSSTKPIVIKTFHNQSNEDLILQAIWDLVERTDAEEISSIKLTYDLNPHDHQERVFSK